MAKKTLTEAQKAAKWRDLAQKRFDRAINAIRGLTKLANTKRYSYTPKQVETMKNTFEARLDAMFAAYEGKSAAKEDSVSL